MTTGLASDSRRRLYAQGHDFFTTLGVFQTDSPTLSPSLVNQVTILRQTIQYEERWAVFRKALRAGVASEVAHYGGGVDGFKVVVLGLGSILGFLRDGEVGGRRWLLRLAFAFSIADVAQQAARSPAQLYFQDARFSVADIRVLELLGGHVGNHVQPDGSIINLPADNSSKTILFNGLYDDEEWAQNLDPSHYDIYIGASLDQDAQGRVWVPVPGQVIKLRDEEGKDMYDEDEVGEEDEAVLFRGALTGEGAMRLFWRPSDTAGVAM